MNYIIISSIKDAYENLNVQELPAVYTERASTFSEGRRQSYLAGRALLKKALESFYGINYLPDMVTLSHGKPVFMESRYPQFNISHSGEYIALCVGSHEQGIDIEFIKERVNFDGLKKRVLSKAERSSLEKIPHEEQLNTFIALWTMRECLIKVSGKGMIDLNAVELDAINHSFKYFLIAPGFEVKTTRLDFLLKDSKPSFLSFIARDSEDINFYVHSGGSLKKADSPKILFSHKN